MELYGAVDYFELPEDRKHENNKRGVGNIFFGIISETETSFDKSR